MSGEPEDLDETKSQDERRKQDLKGRWWFPLVEFLIHIAVGSLIFLFIFIPAVGLNLLVNWLSTKGISPFVLYSLLFAEYFLIAMDILLFVGFLLKTTWRAYTKL